MVIAGEASDNVTNPASDDSLSVSGVRICFVSDCLFDKTFIFQSESTLLTAPNTRNQILSSSEQLRIVTA